MTPSHRRRLAAPLVLALVGCTGPPLVAPVIDLRAGVCAIEVDEFTDFDPPKREQTTFYNLETEEGRRRAKENEERSRPPSFTLSLAHNVAARYRRAEGALAAAGLARPIIVVVTRKHSRGIVANGSRSGDAFEPLPANVPERAIHARGSVSREEAILVLEAPSGAEEHVFRYLSPGEAEAAGLPGLPEDRGAQLVARVADALAPSERAVEPHGAPLAFVRCVIDGRTLEVDLGLERRRVTVRGTRDRLGKALPADPAGLEERLLHSYVRIEWRGGPLAPEKSIFPRVAVEEEPPR